MTFQVSVTHGFLLTPFCQGPPGRRDSGTGEKGHWKVELERRAERGEPGTGRDSRRGARSGGPTLWTVLQGRNSKDEVSPEMPSFTAVPKLSPNPSISIPLSLISDGDVSLSRVTVALLNHYQTQPGKAQSFCMCSGKAQSTFSNLSFHHSSCFNTVFRQ